MIQEVYIRNGLSKREAEVAELVSQGLSNKEVGDRLFVTEKTIKFHLTNIYRKMNITSRTQLIVWSLPYMGFNELQARANNLPNAAAQPIVAVPQRYNTVATQQTVEKTTVNTDGGLSFPLGNSPIGKV